MKKVLCLSMFLFFAPCMSATSQIKPVQLGVRAGLNISNMWDHDYDSKVLLGANAGVFADIRIIQNFYIQPGLSYSRKGAKFEAVRGGSIACKLDYIEMPVMAGYVFDFSNVSLDLHSGFFMACGVGGSYSDGIGGSPFKEEFDRFDAGLTEGVALRFKDISFGVMFSLGLVDIASSDSYDIFSNSTISFNVGYRF